MSDEIATLDVRDGAQAGQRIIQISGPLTVKTLSPLHDAFRTERSPVLIIDLTSVPFIDSAALGTLVNNFVACQKSGRRMVLCGVADRVLNLLRITRVDKLFEIYPTLDEAQRKVRPGDAAKEK